MVLFFFRKGECQLNPTKIDPLDLVRSRFLRYQLNHNIMSFHNTDVSGPDIDYHDNCGDAYASLSGRLRHIHKHVGSSSLPFFPGAHCDRCRRAQINLKNSGRTVSNIGKTHVTRVPRTQMKVVVHTTYVQYPASQTSHSGLSVGMDGQVDDERRGQSLHDDVESGT